jgi:hypothetical protein
VRFRPPELKYIPPENPFNNAVPPPVRELTSTDLGLDRNLQTTQEILEVIRDYVAAYRGKDIVALTSLWPNLTQAQRRTIEDSFANAKTIDFQLTPQGEPEFSSSGDSGEVSRAAVRCQRRVHMIPYRGQSPNAREDQVIIQLQRRDGVWRVVSGG